MNQWNPVIALIVDQKSGRFYGLANQNSQLTPLEEINDELPRQTKGASWKGLADDKIARHIEQHAHDHFKRVGQKLTTYLERPKSDWANASVVLGGPDETLKKFGDVLPNSISERIIGIIHPDRKIGIKELDKQVKAVIQTALIERIQMILTEIDNDRKPGGRGVVGQEAVCDALNLKQVQILLINPSNRYSGTVCPNENYLSTYLETCPACLSPMTKKEDLSVMLRQKAQDQQAEIIEVPDESLFTDDAENLAALKRFPG